MDNEAELRALREQNAGLVRQVEELRDRLDEINALVQVLGCNDPQNQKADKFWREVHQGAVAMSKLINALAATGRFLLMVGGMITIAAAILNSWKAGP
jgi:uncharacterized coiled-coil DUF342 family protein